MQRSNGIDTFTLMVFGGVFVVISNPPRGGYANDMDIGEYIAPKLVPNNIDHYIYISKCLSFCKYIVYVVQSTMSLHSFTVGLKKMKFVMLSQHAKQAASILKLKFLWQ